MAKTPTEQFREIEKQLVDLNSRVDHLRKDADENHADIKGLQDMPVRLAELREEISLVRQRLDDQLKRMEVWGGVSGL
jgi:uncharacterized coiled-coil DUF342 family protein